MSVLFFDFISIHLLFYVVLHDSSSIVLNINEEKQPLVCEVSEENKYFSTADPIWDPSHPQYIQFFSDNRLITACPLDDDNPYNQYMLRENENNETTCKDTSMPEPVSLALAKDFKCGKRDEGLWHAVGYMKIHFGAVYYMCYSKSERVLYTLHTIFKGNRGKLFENWDNVSIRTKIRSGLKLPNLYQNKYEIQLVPFDDMIPMSWKLTTRFDFNFIPANERVKTALDELDKSIRSYTDRSLHPLRIFSGIKIIPKTSDNNESIVWYWRLIENGPFEIIFMVADRLLQPDEIPCKRVLQNKYFILGTKAVPGLFGCESGETIKNYLNVTKPPVLNVPQFTWK